MTKQTLNEVRKLTAEADEAARKAAEMVRPAHKKALEAAQRVRDQLASSTTEASKRERLAGIIEAAVDKRQPNREVCSTVMMQYQNALASKTDVPQHKQIDGMFLWATFPRYAFDWTWGWTDAQRLKALDAFILASRGEIDTGLAEFQKDWSGSVDLANLEKLAELIDPEAVKRYRKECGKLAREYAEASEYADALEQCEPQLFTVATGAESTVSIRNHRAGDVSVSRLKFPGGSVRDLSLDEFNRLRDDRHFSALCDNGILEIVASADLAEAV